MWLCSKGQGSYEHLKYPDPLQLLLYFLHHYHFISLCQDCSRCGRLLSIQPSKVWAWIQTLISLMKVLLFRSIPFFSQLPFMFPTVLGHSCWSSCHMLVTSGRCFRLSHSTLKFIFIHTYLHPLKYDFFLHLFLSENLTDFSVLM